MTPVKGGPLHGTADRPDAWWSPARPASRVAPRIAFVALAGLALAGCGSSFGKYFGTDKPPPAEADKKVATDQATPDATNPPGEDKAYPNLGAVPQTRPVRASIEEQRQAITKGLVADHQNAKYTDEVIRHEPVQTSAPVRSATAQAQPKLPMMPATSAAKPAQTAEAPAAKPPAEIKPAESASAPPKPPALPQPVLPTPPAARQTASTPPAAPVPAAPPPRGNFTLGTAVTQALEQPIAPPPPQADTPLPVVPPAAQPATAPPAAAAQAPTLPAGQAARAAASPTASAPSASIYQPPQVPPAPASMASVSQSKPPPPPLIPGQSPPPAPQQSAALPTETPTPPGYKPQPSSAPAYPQSATPVPTAMQPQAAPQTAARPVLTPPAAYQQQPAYQQQAYPQASQPASPQQLASRSPIRPPPPPISPALPAMTGGDPAAIQEARWRTSYSGGQQVGLILFQNGSAGLGAGDRELLRRVATLARQNGSIVRVVGHASGRTGDMDMGRHQTKNLDISLARANAAAAELRAAGVPAERIVVEAKGDSEPVYRETMPSGEAGNRRVDVYLQ